MFNGSSSSSCCSGWAVPAACTVSVNASCRTGTTRRGRQRALLSPFMSAAKKMLGHLLNKLDEALLAPLSPQPAPAQDNPAHELSPAPRQPRAAAGTACHRQMFAHLWCLVGWVPLSGDKASGKDWGPEKLDSITLCRIGPGCLSGFEYCSRENKIN